MYLALKDLEKLFSDKQGIQDDFVFYTISDEAAVSQPRGLFVPVNEESGELSEAIINGAIAAVWDREKKVPHYTPNHFPIFFTDDQTAAIRNILNLYIEKLDGETDKTMEITNIKFSNKKLLNKSNDTYDIAVMLKKLVNHNDNIQKRRG
jgi:UDP-N-acetylmuramyl pentapeptide synthase